MHAQDKLGRRRTAAQNRGLRPLFPELPADFNSRLLRVAMAAESWDLFDQRIALSAAPTRPRAVGQVLEHALREYAVSSVRESSELATWANAQPAHDWQQWQIEKEAALLNRSVYGALAIRGES